MKTIASGEVPVTVLEEGAIVIYVRLFASLDCDRTELIKMKLPDRWQALGQAGRCD